MTSTYKESRFHNLTFTNGRCEVAGNYGGGVKGVSTGRRSIIRNCVASCTRSGGYNFMQGGGAHGGSWYDCAFISNRLVNPLELYNCRGGGLMAAWVTAVSNCYFEGNYITGKGGAVYCANQVLSPFLSDCVFTNNSSTSEGAALYMYGTSNATIRSCLFVSNTVKYVLYIWEWDTSRAAIIAGLSSCGRVENCTIADNTLLGSSYALRGSQYDLFQRNNLVYNNCLAGATTIRALEDWYAGTNVVRHCYIDSRAANAESFDKDENVIGPDPKFKDSARGDYRLTRNSACYNAGTNLAWMTEGAVDMGSGFRDNHPTTITAFGETFQVGVKLEKIAPRARIERDMVDIGCFEYWAPSGTGVYLR